ncbi:MAG: DUF2279 domain-containing protein [Bacteroidia bacterium]|nr:DUF2279 domain-containing protein [Bacteroidia bacterium]
MRFRLLYIVLLFLSAWTISNAQLDSTVATKNGKVLVHSISGGIYVSTFVLLNELWYSGYDRSAFHFFNDSKEWLQIDKAGHMHAGYFIAANVLYPSYKLAGYDNKKATYLAMSVAWVYQATIEVLDGFSLKWGASWSDLVANSIGVGLAGTQQLHWGEQRILLKYSSYSVDYSNDPIVLARAENLYGTGSAERLLKDYNGITYWASANLHSFGLKSPKWLNLAVGYGAEGMLGGFQNTWSSNGMQYDYNHIQRRRQFYLSPDLDFTKIKIKGKAWKVVAPILNIFKFPAPALEMSSEGLKGHWIFF